MSDRPKIVIEGVVAVPPADAEPARRPAAGPSGPRRVWNRFLAGLQNTSRRNIYFSVLAIPGHLVMAGSKAAVLLVSFSAFMTANVLFTLGLAAIKLVVVVADRRTNRRSIATAIPQAYRTTGVIVLVLSVAYIVSCLPLALGTNTSERYSQNMAIAIAALAFTELGFSVHGLLASRKNKDVLMEAIKLSNLAASLVLLVLAQTALLSMTPETTVDPSRYNGMWGVGMGAVAGLIGIYMISRGPAHFDGKRAS